jgi:hypothetical protein
LSAPASPVTRLPHCRPATTTCHVGVSSVLSWAGSCLASPRIRSFDLPPLLKCALSILASPFSRLLFCHPDADAPLPAPTASPLSRLGGSVTSTAGFLPVIPSVNAGAARSLTHRSICHQGFLKLIRPDEGQATHGARHHEALNCGLCTRCSFAFGRGEASERMATRRSVWCLTEALKSTV